MQLTIQDGILIIMKDRKIIHTETISHASIVSYLLTCGYRQSTAQAIAYGTLSDRQATIALAQFIRLLAISVKDDERST